MVQTRRRSQERPEQILDGHRTTALAAALEAGFGSYAQFHRVLRAETGRSPSRL